MPTYLNSVRGKKSDVVKDVREILKLSHMTKITINKSASNGGEYFVYVDTEKPGL